MYHWTVSSTDGVIDLIDDEYKNDVLMTYVGIDPSKKLSMFIVFGFETEVKEELKQVSRFFFLVFTIIINVYDDSKFFYVIFRLLLNLEVK